MKTEAIEQIIDSWETYVEKHICGPEQDLMLVIAKEARSEYASLRSEGCGGCLHENDYKIKMCFPDHPCFSCKRIDKDNYTPTPPKEGKADQTGGGQVVEGFDLMEEEGEV